MSKTVFIADLHLDKRYPQAVATFLRYLDNLATQSVDALYILGDLFEYWLGDDCLDATANSVAQGLSRFHQHSQSPIYYIHGNRDFLLGQNYAKQCCMQILPEQEKINLYGVKTLILHGDTLCTDDVDYMQFRRQVRTPQWQEKVLALPVWLRRLKAIQMRYRSKKANQIKQMHIMNVAQTSVDKSMQAYDVELMIHGHTHRPAIHRWQVKNQCYTRCVVGDWYTQGSVLEVSKNRCELITLPLKNQ